MFVKGQEVWFHIDNKDVKKSIGKSTVFEVYKDNVFNIKDIGNVPNKNLFVSREDAVRAATEKLKKQHEALLLAISTHYYDVKRKMVKVITN